MSTPELTRPTPSAEDPSESDGPFTAQRVVVGAFVALCVVALVGFFVYPTYPEYDGLYALLWGREFWDGGGLSLEAYRAPTPHPLWTLLGIVLAPLGNGAARGLIFLDLACFLALIAGVYQLGRRSFTLLIGVLAAVLLLTRLNFLFLSVRGFLDIPYMAAIVWAFALEASRPRRGGWVWVLLATAGLLRPEAWLLIGIYFIWMAWPATWSERARYLAYSAVAPVIWVLSDLIATGDPMFSQSHTQEFVASVDRNRPLFDLPQLTIEFVVMLDRWTVVGLGVIGIVVAGLLAWRRAILPAVLIVAGIATFVITNIAGAATINRYMLIVAIGLIVFAGVALGGFTLLKDKAPQWRIPWAIAGGLALIAAVVLTGSRYDPAYLREFLGTYRTGYEDLDKLVKKPAVQAGLKCGPVAVPNHKLIPQVRWFLDVPEDQVLARGDANSAGKLDRGVAIVVTKPTVRRNPNFDPYAQRQDGRAINQPPAGWKKAGSEGGFTAYVNCGPPRPAAAAG